LAKHPQHPACLQALQDSVEPITDSLALAETSATLTGFYKLPTEAATALTLGLKESVNVKPLSEADYDTAISEACQRGIMGGGIYASLHATFARRLGVTSVVTRNAGHFAHGAPELQLIVPS
jgi:hypothetical protein